MHSTLWSHVGFGGMLGQYAFAAAAGHPYLLAILRYVRQASVEPSWARVPVSAARAPALGTPVPHTHGAHSMDERSAPRGA